MTVWIVSGALFCVIVRGRNPISLWLTIGTAVFLAGWLAVGLPIVALGDRIHRLTYWTAACLGGLGGALLMLFPNLLTRAMDPEAHYARFSLRDLAWPAVAFVVAGATTALYRFVLIKDTRISD